MKRRQFLHQTTIVSLGFLTLSRCTSDKGISGQVNELVLVKDPEGYLDLPEGFSYKVISKTGDMMDDGFFVPGRPDGMGTFSGEDGRVIIIRNHENSPTPLRFSGFGANNEKLSGLDPALLYDHGKGILPGLGGTTTLIYNEITQEVETEYFSLAGTYRNCAGGVTPWGSWLTCEEDVTREMDGINIEKDHGYVFEVPASSKGLVRPVPIKSMGRFNHEAVAVDPNTGIVYMTEDRDDGLLYRFIPNEKGNLLEGGRLQALVLKDKASLDTRNWKEKRLLVGEPIRVSWVDLDNVNAAEDDLRYRGHAAGAARFARGEGMWLGDGEIYFACTNGGPKEYGQIFRYRFSDLEGQGGEEGQLELFIESEDKTVLHMCDNLTVAPWGDLYVCEDNGRENRIHVIRETGQINTFAINKANTSEFAGVVFSPSGRTMFVNLQENGETLAISGPWDSI